MDTKLAVLQRAGASVVADIFDELGMQPAVLDPSIRPLVPGRTFVGPAYTVAGTWQPWTGGGDRAKLAAIDEMPKGSVAVWAGREIQSVCCFGDLLSAAMEARGVVGVVVDGGIRDVATIRSMDLPVMTRYITPAQSIGRWRVTHVQEPVAVRGGLAPWVTITPGDTIVADDDGAIAVPAAILPSVAERAEQVLASESGAREDITNGMKLLDALKKYGHL